MFSGNREMQRFIDSDLYLNQNKFREWIEGILGKITNYTNKEIVLKNISYPVSHLFYIKSYVFL